MSIILRDWFSSTLREVKCSPEVRAYIVDVLAQQGGEQITGSIVVKLSEIRMTGDFVAHQKLGDWALWSSSVTPDLHRNVVVDVGRTCYKTCHRMLHYAWPLYEELYVELPRITNEVMVLISKVETGPGLIQPNLKMHVNNE